MKWLIALPFILQGLLMFIDEFYFHRKRGLPQWERWGHPIDTLAFLAPLSLALLASPHSISIALFFALSIFSSLIITKDEWVHHEHCEPKENWLHSLLFIIHPLVLLAAFFLWLVKYQAPIFFEKETLRMFQGAEIILPIITVLTMATLIHQVVYWNVLEPRFKQRQQRNL